MDTTLAPSAHALAIKGRMISCPEVTQGVPLVMGILNVTPDSFYDGGAFDTTQAALRRAGEMLREGATIIDVGGESTRPRGTTYGEGASVVEEDEELRRVIPVIRGIAEAHPDALISIDTYKPRVAREAVDAGAHVINDVTGLRLGRGSAEVAAETGAALVVMHAVGAPGTMPQEHAYRDVVREVTGSLARSVAVARAAGVGTVVVDPGFGFGKSPAENLRIIRHIETLKTLGCPILVGISRKSTIGSMLAQGDDARAVEDRLFGTLGATAVAVMGGASIVRTHDVRPTLDLLTVMHETLNA